MIKINLTLIIQIINIYLTYLFLHRYLFVPIVRRIIRRKQIEKQVHDEIYLKSNDITNFDSEKSIQLAQFQKDSCVSYDDELVEARRGEPLEIEKIPEPSPKELEDIKRAIAERIVHGP